MKSSGRFRNRTASRSRPSARPERPTRRSSRTARSRRQDRRRRQADQRYRRADQSAGAQCHDRSGARRRSRPRLCGCGGRSEGAGRPDRESDRRDRRADRRACSGNRTFDRGDRRDRAHHSRYRRHLRCHRRGRHRAGRGDPGNRAQRRDGFETHVGSRRQVSGVTQVAQATNGHASAARGVADNLGTVASRIRGQVDQFFERLNAA